MRSNVLPKVREAKNGERDMRPWCCFPPCSICSLVDYRQLTSQTKPLHFLPRDISFQQWGWKTWHYGNEPHLSWSLELGRGWQLLQHGPQHSFSEAWVPTPSQPRSSCDFSCVLSERKSNHLEEMEERRRDRPHKQELRNWACWVRPVGAESP